MKYFFSPSTRGAYIDSLNFSIPEDAVEITKELYGELFTTTIDGEVGVGEKGLPVLIPTPKPTEADQALKKRDSLLGEAARKMAPLQDAVDLGEATPSEEADLIAWKRYRMLLNRIQQQSGFPKAIEWPAVPSPSP